MNPQLSPELFQACVAVGVALLVILVMAFAVTVMESEITRGEADDVP